MKFNCAMCHADKTGRKYVYASSTREVKLYVCSDCHRMKVIEMNQAAAKFGKTMILGVLQPKTGE
jgi:hypothetical protein